MPAERPFGPTGTLFPALGQGTYLLEHEDPKQVVRALLRGLELGLSHIDTSELYGSGRVEEVIAEVLEGRRAEVLLVSKVIPQNATRAGTVAACERSLKRLRTDYLDGYLLHWPHTRPFAETLAAFEELVQEGKIRWYGVSNFDADELASAVALAGPGKIVCNQIFYHLAERTSEHRVIPACEAHGVAVVGYTPFGRATFPPPRGGATLERLAKARGVTPHQLALAFLTRRPTLFAIPKATNPAHVEANARVRELVLEPAELLELEEAFPTGAPRPGIARI